MKLSFSLACLLLILSALLHQGAALRASKANRQRKLQTTCTRLFDYEIEYFDASFPANTTLQAYVIKKSDGTEFARNDDIKGLLVVDDVCLDRSDVDTDQDTYQIAFQLEDTSQNL